MRSLYKTRLMRRAVLLRSKLMKSKYKKRPTVNFNNGNPKPYEIVSSTTVPRCCYYSNLSGVSKSFRSLVRSPELAQMGSFICVFFTEPNSFGRIFHWFTFDTHEKKTSVLNSFPVFPRQMLCCPIVSIGSTIYFIGGSMYHTSPSIRFLDPWSGELCEGPSMKVARSFPGVIVVDGKIYVMGGCRKDEIQVEVFDPKTQTWEVGPLSPYGRIQYEEGLPESYKVIVTESVAVEGKIYGMSYKHEGRHVIYDKEDGRCETFKMEDEEAWRRGGVCVINNVIYVYYKNLGLMWYDSKDKVWRLVKGLKLDKPINMPVEMVDCNGKLAFLWEDLGCIISKITKKKKIWCTIFALDRCGVDIHGTVERSDLGGSVPIYYDIWRCLDVSDQNLK